MRKGVARTWVARFGFLEHVAEALATRFGLLECLVEMEVRHWRMFALVQDDAGARRGMHASVGLGGERDEASGEQFDESVRDTWGEDTPDEATLELPVGEKRKSRQG